MSAQDIADDPDVVDANLVRDLVTQLNDLQDRVETLEDDITEAQTLNDALRRQNKELKRALAGSTDEFSKWNTDTMAPIYQRVVQLEEQLTDHHEKFEMLVVEDGQTAKPDERALHLRQVLWNKTKRVSNQQNDPGSDDEFAVTMTRDECTSALGHDLARASIIDAMKRAADGETAENPDAISYKPVQGSSSLDAVDAIRYEPGTAVGASGGPRQSAIVMEPNDLTGVEARDLTVSDHCKNLTTVSGDGGGS